MRAILCILPVAILGVFALPSFAQDKIAMLEMSTKALADRLSQAEKKIDVLAADMKIRLDAHDAKLDELKALIMASNKTAPSASQTGQGVTGAQVATAAVRYKWVCQGGSCRAVPMTADEVALADAAPLNSVSGDCATTSDSGGTRGGFLRRVVQRMFHPFQGRRGGGCASCGN
jgi:hypothetical protein